ncbi:hypothetical protein [Streptomyces hypolithicus]
MQAGDGMRAARLPPHLEVDLDEWRPWHDNSCRLPVNQDTRLNAIRHSFYEEAIAGRAEQGRQIRVTTYVLASRGVDVEGTHHALTEHAQRMDWRLGGLRFTDKYVSRPDDARPAFNEACRYAAAGFVDGILTPDRAALTPSDEAYEAYLRWLHDRLSFVAFLPTTSQRLPSSSTPIGLRSRDGQESSKRSSCPATLRPMAPGRHHHIRNIRANQWS